MAAVTRSPILRKLAMLIPLCFLSFSPAEPQTAERQGDWIDPVAVGAATGLGMAIFAIKPEGEGLVSDRTFLAAAIMGGLGVALLTRHLANDADPDEHLRPRFRLTAGGGHGPAGMYTEYAMATRAPVNERWELEGRLLIANNRRGRLVTDSRYEQNLMVLARAAYHLMDGRTWNPTVVAGGGLAAISIDRRDQEGADRFEQPESFFGPVLDGALGVEQAGRTRVTAEVGYRLIAMKDPAADESFGTGGWYVTAGLAFGF